jgi:hypothetical protein
VSRAAPYRLPVAFGEQESRGVLCQEMGGGTDSLYLPLGHELRLAVSCLVYGEFNTGGAGIEGYNNLAHLLKPATACLRNAWAYITAVAAEKLF